MAQFMNLCVLLATFSVLMLAQYATAAPITKLSVRLYHGESQKFVRAPTDSPVILSAAVGVPDSFTALYLYPRAGNKTAFESVNYPSYYLTMNDNGTLSLSPPKGKIYEFNLVPAGKASRYSYMGATVPSGATCYVSFDVNGAPLANQCNPLTGLGLEYAKVQVSLI